jgi:hypothetical protein
MFEKQSTIAALETATGSSEDFPTAAAPRSARTHALQHRVIALFCPTARFAAPDLR